MAERASSSSLINYIDFDKICRTCLKESDNLKSLFLNYGANDGCNYGVMVAECTKLQFAQNDGLPETICRVCIKDVKSAFAFKQKVEKSELALRTFYEQVKGKHAFEPSIKEEVGDDVNIKDEINVNDVKVDGQNDDDAFNNDDLHFNDNDDFSEDDVKPLNDYNNSLKKHVPQQEERSTGSTYSCALCDSSFSRASLLKRHKCSAKEDMAVDENGKENLEDSLSEESFVCLSCNKKFEDIFRLQEHMKTHLKAPKKRGRPSKRDLKAKLQLESVLDKADLEDLDLDLDQDYVPYSSKMKTRECSKEYFCGVCDKVFITRSYFQTHMKTHTDRKSSECKICERSYIRVFLLKKHLLSHNTAEGLTSINFKAKLKLFENHEKYSDLDPIAETNQRLCEIIAEDIREGRLQRYMTTGADEAGDGGNYTCETCGVKFPYEMALNKHILRSHRGQNVSVKFLDPDYQKREKKFHCQNCNKSFYRAAHLAKHARTHVASERKFECSLCKKKFNRKDNLRSHMRVHDPNKEDLESNCLCVYCGRSFSNSSNLIVHMRRHTGEKPYQCDICEKGFPRSSDLLCHRRTHTGEKPCLCTICGKGFSRSNKLVRHMRIHTGQRPYKCTFCDKAFTQSNDLTLHIRRHTGDKPYVCNICGDRFIQGTALQTHRRLLNHHEPPQPPQPPVNSVNNPHRPPHWNKAMKTTKSTQNNVSNDGGSTADVKPADIKPAANLTPGEGNNNESATQPAFISTPDVVAIANHTLFSISQYTQNFN